MIKSDQVDVRAAYSPPAEPRFIGTVKDVANTDDPSQPVDEDGSFNYTSG